MPQKRNPRELDRIRTLAAQVLGGTTALQLLNHNIDTGMHDYRTITPLIETMELATAVHRRFALLFEHIHVDMEIALAELTNGFSTSTEIAETLYREARISFRTAHEYAKQIVEHARATNLRLVDVPPSDLKRIYREVAGEALPIPVKEIKNANDPRNFIAIRDSRGGPSENAVGDAIVEQRRMLLADERWRKVRDAHLRFTEDRLNAQLRNLSIQEHN